MTKTKKTILSKILCYAMVLCLSVGAVLPMPMTAFAEDFTLDDYKYATNYFIKLGGYAHMEEIGDGEFAFVGKLPASGVEIQGSIPLNPGFHKFSKNFSWTGDPNVTLVGSPGEGDDVTFVYKVISIAEATLTVTKGKLIYSWDNLNTAIALTPGTLEAPATEATTIKLTWDLTQPADSIKPINIPMGKNIILDLNGRVLNANGEDSAIHLGSNGTGTLTVIDSTPTTEHKGYIDQNGLWHWDENGEHSLLTGETSKTIKGGIITGGSHDYNGGLSVGGAGTFNMYGGTICGNKKPDDGYNKGAVRVTGIFNMYGGTICSNSLSGVYIYGGIFNMYGGTICDNWVSSGGGVCIIPDYGSNGTFNMLGGTIRGNRVSNGGGGIYNWYDQGKSGKLTLGGTAVVSGNFKGDEANDVQQVGDHDCDFNISTDTPPENGMMVGLYSQNIKVKGASEADTKYFFSDSADYYVNFNNNNTPDTSDDYLELKAPADGNKIINIVPSVNGKVTTVPAKEAAENATVTVTVTPDEGYQLKSLKYNDGTTDYDITKDQTSGNYQFTMPGYAVTITAEFEVSHTHIGIKQNGQPATESAAGYKDYYKCDCGKYYEDAEGKTEITDLSAWKAEGGNGYVAPTGGNDPEPGDNEGANLWWLWVLIAVVVVGGGFCVWFFFIKKKDDDDPDDPDNTPKEPEPEEDEEIETEVVYDEVKGAFIKIRYNKSFTAKLIQSKDETKEYYSELKNYILSFKFDKKQISDRISWTHESFRLGREILVKMIIKGKTLCLCLPLNANDYADSKYHVEDKSDKKSYSATPTLYRIKNPRRASYAKDLIDVVMAKFGGEKTELNAIDYAKDYPYEELKPLINRQLVKVLDDSHDVRSIEKEINVLKEVSVTQVDKLMTDEQTEKLTGKSQRIADKTRKATINVDTISAYFNDGETVTIEELKKRVPSFDKNATYYKVCARGTLDKKLTVDADSASSEAKKMILLTGGKIILSTNK